MSRLLITMNLIQRVLNIFQRPTKTYAVEVKNVNFSSKHLERNVTIDVFLPPQYHHEKRHLYPTFYFNDGQDMPRLGMFDLLQRLFSENKLAPCIVVAAHCNDNRISNTKH